MDGSEGYFVEPTVVVSKDPKSKLMTEEIFGPILTVYFLEFSIDARSMFTKTVNGVTC